MFREHSNVLHLMVMVIAKSHKFLQCEAFLRSYLPAATIPVQSGEPAQCQEVLGLKGIVKDLVVGCSTRSLPMASPDEVTLIMARPVIARSLPIPSPDDLLVVARSLPVPLPDDPLVVARTLPMPSQDEVTLIMALLVVEVYLVGVLEELRLVEEFAGYDPGILQS